jgi:serine/threonine protein kinase
MNAETLIGTVLGTCTLQQLVGQGGMGAVFLAQQSRPKRQVAVKVLLPMTPLNQHQLAAFLERFRRETDAAASLEHPNIMPVHEYGERGGLAYLVMPYIGGGTMRDELEREGPLPFARAAYYLEQLAAALDFAHEHGVIHRDIKPANIMVTPEGRLLLADFGLVKIVAEGQAPQIRLTGAGAPVGTPDYMAPEQVIGEEIDTRADIYAVGVILFQMVTGTTPFHGETPMQIAAQHLQVPPPAPQMWRPDLPISAEQVILRAMSKRPTDRYMRASDLALAFRMALIEAGIQLEPSYASARNGSTGTHRAVKGQFEPMRQTASVPRVNVASLQNRAGTGPVPAAVAQQPKVPTTEEMQPAPRANGGGLLSRTGKFPLAGSGALPTIPTTGGGTGPQGTAGGGLLSRTGKFQTTGASNFLSQSAQQPALVDSHWEHIGELPKTGGINAQLNATGPQKMKLTGPAKVVKVPVAGQPGQYVTGLLPMSEGDVIPADPNLRKPINPAARIVLIVVALVIIFGGALGFFMFVRNNSQTNQNQPGTGTQATANPQTTRSNATTPAQANVILSDPLDRNIHGWLTTPANVYTFKDGAYHITNDDDKNGRATVLPTDPYTGSLAYQLDIEQIAGDDTKPTNSFGMIFRFTMNEGKKNKNGDPIITFYSFEVVNTKSGEYQFWKYDNTDPANPWTAIKDGHLAIGSEFHQGKGVNAKNTIKIAMNGDKFTITVNGKPLAKTFQDGSFSQGTVGMIVNLKGSEVAFQNLLITKN